MTATQTASYETAVIHRTELRYRTLSEGLHVFSLRQSARDASKPAGTADAKIVQQGFVDDANLAKLLARDYDIARWEPVESDSERRFVPVLITREGRDLIAAEGNFLDSGDVWDLMTKDGLLLRATETDFVTAFENGAAVDDIHFTTSFDHSIVDRFGRPLRAANRFDYLDSDLSDDVFDLQKVVETLDGNPEAEVVKGRFEKELIGSIPRYNRFGQRSRCLEIVWRPSEESWDRLLVQMEGRKTDAGRTVLNPRRFDLVMDYDVLGIVAAGCRLEKPTATEAVGHPAP